MKVKDHLMLISDKFFSNIDVKYLVNNNTMGAILIDNHNRMVASKGFHCHPCWELLHEQVYLCLHCLLINLCL